MSFYYGKKWVDSMNWKKCQRNYMCKTCSSEKYCDGGIKDNKEKNKNNAKKNKRKRKKK